MLTVEDLERIAPDFFACGIECGPGWFGLLLEAADKAPPGVYAVQIKEKFGGLRLYYSPRDAAMVSHDAWNTYEDLIGRLEDRSFALCEECGEPGSCDALRGRWLKTLCVDCKKHKAG